MAAIWYASKTLTFNSALEPESKGWLDTSEILLLVSTIALVIGLIGEWPDSESWKARFAYKVAKFFVVAGCVGELLGDGGIFVTSRRLQFLQDLAVKEATNRATDAAIEASGAHTTAANANERAAKLEKENLVLERLLAQRRVFGMVPKEQSFVYAELAKFKGTTALVQVVPDFEARKLANDIFAILKGDGYAVRYVDSQETHFEPQEIWDGVSVHTRKASMSPSPINTGIAAGKAIANLLDATSISPNGTPVFDDLSAWDGRPGYLKFKSPDDTVLVTVGMKPVAAMLGQSSFTINVVDPTNPIK
jgi:hypothetical protein